MKPKSFIEKRAHPRIELPPDDSDDLTPTDDVTSAVWGDEFRTLVIPEPTYAAVALEVARREKMQKALRRRVRRARKVAFLVRKKIWRWTLYGFVLGITGASLGMLTGFGLEFGFKAPHIPTSEVRRFINGAEAVDTWTAPGPKRIR